MAIDEEEDDEDDDEEADSLATAVGNSICIVSRDLTATSGAHRF